MNSLIAPAVQALAAALLVTAGAWISYTVAAAMTPRQPTLLRWLAGVTTGVWMATAAFHLLAAVEQFTLPVACGGAALLLAAAMHPGLFAATRAMYGRDRRVVRWLRAARVPRWRRLFMCGLGVLAAVLAIRTLILPPLAWDTLTYHAVKSALWAQNAGELPLHAPGGWSAYRNYFGGAEILTAWAMLPFRQDTLALLVDAVEWIALGLAIVCLARELGVREPFASAAAGFVLAIPTFQLLVGSGYVELLLNLAFVSALAFAIRFVRRPQPALMVLALAALGIAAGVKVTALPLASVVSAGIVIRALVQCDAVRKHAAALVLGTAAAAAMVMPWLWKNIDETGYPLSPMPVSVAGFTLGRANDAILWYGERPDLEQSWRSELGALGKVFRFPPSRDENLGGLAAVPLLLFPLGVLTIARRSALAAAMLTGLAVIIAALFYAPSFRTIRLGWSTNSSRFLLPLICVAVPMSIAWWRQAPGAARWYWRFLVGSIAFHAVLVAAGGWSAGDAVATILSAVVLTILVAATATVAFRRTPLTVRVAITAVIGVGLVAGLTTWRDAHRYQVLRSAQVLTGVPKYWMDAAMLVDEPKSYSKIAVTAGPFQNADNWLVYYFLGRKLQNEITYVSVAGDGRIPEFRESASLARHADETVWTRRLLEQRVTHVMSFMPPSVELGWMEQRPDVFERVAGESGRWGFFSVKGAKDEE